MHWFSPRLSIMVKTYIKDATMSRPREMLYTKAQLLLILAGWECVEPLPKKGYKLYVCFAGQEIDLAEVEQTTLKSDSGERLWRVTTSSRAGREFDAVVQEAHVLTYRAYRMDEYRRANLARHHALMVSANA